MNVNPDINFEELARSTDDFNGAQLKVVSVEVGMLALRRAATETCSLIDARFATSSPVKSALAMISPGLAAAFASPPVVLALAMIVADVGGGESSMFERETTKLHTFSSFQKPLETPIKLPVVPNDKAAAKADALAVARDLERNAKIGSARGLNVYAMATSVQKSVTDVDRVQRLIDSEAMGTA